MIKKCEFCGNEFKTENLKKRCCKQSCSNKLSWKENRKHFIKSRNTKEAKENNSNAQKKKWTEPGYKEKMHKIKKETSNKKENKIKFKKRIQKWQIENKEDYLNMRKEISNRDDLKEKVSIFHKELWKNKNYRKSQLEKFSKGQLKSWSNPEIANKRFNSGFKFKEYKFPSGKIIKVQGYEPQAITELLKTHKENDLVIGVKNINKEIGLIKYMFEKKERTYYPDIFIKSENKIIEVKSKWTFEQQKKKNLAKEQACLQQGFNFEFKIIA